MAALQRCQHLWWLFGARTAQIHYSIPEELEKGSFISNIIKDLELEPQELMESGVFIVSRSRMQPFSLNPRSRSLVTAGMARIVLTVLDGNVNAPVFTQPIYRMSVPEYLPVLSVNATDQDEGIHAQIAYSFVKITERITQIFCLNVLTEEISTSATLDYEDSSFYELDVEAQDQSDASSPRGASIFSVNALDPDSEENAQVAYSLPEDILQGTPLSSYLSINSNTGVVYALCSSDYEQSRDIQVLVIASNNGNPSLSSNASLSLLVLDQNDNVPEILYPPLPTDSSTGVELAPCSAKPGYLVVAVDRDSGQNSWLSCCLLKASDPGLFSVELHTGEVRTAGSQLDRESLKQSHMVEIQDHSQPPLSATVTLMVVVANSIPDVLADLSHFNPPHDFDASDLTLYLVWQWLLFPAFSLPLLWCCWCLDCKDGTNQAF
ncbi:hypothetical protein GHT09_010776 [Marmota monax]|uniref:Cadherin domain-containing protein n=1 Tax=Marmota monax TaxID=9995 RepID=A0A834QKL5_MARMO|nr:hypothetical protein GHT09_010776 [Marmota monax]